MKTNHVDNLPLRRSRAEQPLDIASFVRRGLRLPSIGLFGIALFAVSLRMIRE